MDNSIKKIAEIISDAIQSNTFIKAISSKPNKEAIYIKVELTSVKDKQDLRKIKLISYTKTQALTDVQPVENLEKLLLHLLEEQFAFCDVYCEDFVYHYKKSGKGTITILKKKVIAAQKTKAISESHDRPKAYSLAQDEAILKALGISSSNGLVYKEKYGKYKQINRFIELVLHHTKADKAPSFKIMDMGCGKGYLTFGLHQVLSKAGVNVSTVGYELRSELVDHCNTIAQELKIKNLTFEAKDIFDVETTNLDLLIALHACDIATDLAIKKGLDAKSKFIILSPCCHKQIRRSIQKTNTITRFGIYEERMAEMITDSIRVLILEYFGYKCQILEFVSTEHSGKNTMIIAEYTGNSKPNAIQEIETLKATYGINKHYLEELVSGLS